MSSVQDSFSHSALQNFLESYAQNLRKGNLKPNEDMTNATDDESDTDKAKKSWNLMNAQKQKHPYKDKDGWVSLEPIPWSVSKISKWQNKPRPVERPWNNKYHNSYEASTIRPWIDYESVEGGSNGYKYTTRNPYIDKKKYQVYLVDDHNENIKPIYPKPSNVFLQANPSSHPYHSHYYDDEACNHNLRDDGIITDGLPPNFPPRHVEINRKQDSEMVRDQHLFMSDGDWVLLSTTKGYKRPTSKRRSLEFQPETIGTHRSVRLTVLPPLKDSKVHMTTSHGGLLQVDSAFESVEQAQKKFQKNRNKLKRPNKVTKKKYSTPISDSAIAFAHTPQSDSAAVLAGVGAGIIPATMAMLVPMAMQGRRKKRDIFTTGYPTEVDVTLSRYY